MKPTTTEAIRAASAKKSLWLQFTGWRPDAFAAVAAKFEALGAQGALSSMERMQALYVATAIMDRASLAAWAKAAAQRAAHYARSPFPREAEAANAMAAGALYFAHLSTVASPENALGAIECAFSAAGHAEPGGSAAEHAAAMEHAAQLIDAQA